MKERFWNIAVLAIALIVLGRFVIVNLNAQQNVITSGAVSTNWVGFTAQKKGNAAVKQYFTDYLVKCDTNEIRSVWFLQSNPRIGMEMTINLESGAVFTGRDVYNWALQGVDINRRLSHFQVLTLKQITSNMPPSDTNADFARSVFTSVRYGKNVDVFQHGRHRPLAIVQRIYDIGGGIS
jgi:hypothetical protein